MSEFDNLLKELQQEQEELAKALPADNGEDEAKIQAAAGEGGGDNDGDEGDGDGAGDNDGDEEDEEGKGEMAKSFEFTLEDGSLVQAIDGTELVKSLSARLETQESNLAKSLGSIAGLMKAQSDLIKSLSAKVEKLSGEGRGRKTVVSVQERPAQTMAKSQEPEGVSPDAFFAKAMDALAAGRISGADIATAEACLNRGQAIPTSIAKAVLL